jgi:hypothetical protein
MFELATNDMLADKKTLLHWPDTVACSIPVSALHVTAHLPLL